MSLRDRESEPDGPALHVTLCIIFSLLATGLLAVIIFLLGA